MADRPDQEPSPSGETKSKQDEPTRERRVSRRIRWYVAAAVLVYTVLTLVSYNLICVVPDKETARKAICMNTLRQIGLAVRAYIDENDGYLPLGLSALRKYGLDPKKCSCPSVRNVEPGQWTYVYSRPAAMLKDIERPQDTIIAYDRLGNHPGGSYVVFLDGHVEWKRDFVSPEAKPPKEDN